MNNKDSDSIKGILNEIAAGSVSLTSFMTMNQPGASVLEFTPILPKSGRGKIDYYGIYSGIHAMLGWFYSDSLDFVLYEPEDIVQIVYCHRGMMRWKKAPNIEFSIGPGEMMVRTIEKKNKETVLFPLGYAEVFSLSMSPKIIRHSMPDFLRKIGFSADDFFQKVASRNEIILAASNSKTSFFSTLFSTPADVLKIYLEWKAQEILWQTDRFVAEQPVLSEHYLQYVHIVREIHSRIVSDLSQRLTIYQLIESYPIDSTTFQDIFKNLYGAPIGSYVRRRRMEEACQILQFTDKTIEEIAEMVGYQSRTKFSQTFKDIIGESPGEYRKRLR